MQEINTEVSAPKVTMIVPVWNQLELTKRMLESVRRFVQLPYKIVFVDNGSTDGTREWLEQIQKSNPHIIEVIRNHTNTGFAHATNQGLSKAQGHVLLLNNDVEFLRLGTLESMLTVLEADDNLGAIGPTTDMCMGPQNVNANKSYPELHKARFLIGFCMLIKENVWKQVGKLDEGFNNAGQDDLDYSIRIRQAGFGMVVLRSVFLHHMGGASQPGGHGGGDFAQKEEAGRQVLIQKWGEDVVNELFLPVDFSGVRVLVSVPVWGSVYPEAYMNHIGEMMQEVKDSASSGMEIEFAPLIRSAICCARNELVRVAIKRDCTHLFFMDDDMIMPRGGLHRLVSHGLDIVSGLCHLRTPPHFPSMFMDPDHSTGKIFYICKWPEGQMIRVDNIGSACVLVKTDVYKKVQEMEFKGDDGTMVKEGGEDLWYLYGKARPGEHTVGEDVFFCKLARDAGYKIWVDTACQFGHIGPPTIYDTNYFQQIRERDAHNGQFPGLVYTDYESALDISSRSDGLLTPEKLASRMAGDNTEQGEIFERLYAGVVGDGKHPGGASAAGNQGVRRKPAGSPV